MRKWFAAAALVSVALPMGASTTAVAATAAPVLFHVPALGLQAGIGGIYREVQSTNWAGYADTSQTYQTVSSSWVQPTVTCTKSKLGGLLGGGAAYSAFWVGLDGYTSSSVEQTGSDSDCTSKGVPSYYAWYEMYPAGSVDLSTSTNPVAPGDVMTGSVTSNSAGTTFIMTLTDTSKTHANWTWTDTLSGSGLARSSVEWVAEAPSTCVEGECSVLPLADFGTVNFSSSSAADTAGASGTISAFSDVELQMASSSTVKASPSALSDGGADFSVTWQHS